MWVYSFKSTYVDFRRGSLSTYPRITHEVFRADMRSFIHTPKAGDPNGLYLADEISRLSLEHSAASLFSYPNDMSPIAATRGLFQRLPHSFR